MSQINKDWDLDTHWALKWSIWVRMPHAFWVRWEETDRNLKHEFWTQSHKPFQVEIETKVETKLHSLCISLNSIQLHIRCNSYITSLNAVLLFFLSARSNAGHRSLPAYLPAHSSPFGSHSHIRPLKIHRLPVFTFLHLCRGQAEEKRRTPQCKAVPLSPQLPTWICQAGRR